MPALTHQRMKIWGIGLLVAGIAFRLVAGTLLNRLLDWLNSASGPSPELAYQVFSIVDSTLIPGGIALLVGGIVVAAIGADQRSIEEKSP